MFFIPHFRQGDELLKFRSRVEPSCSRVGFRADSFTQGLDYRVLAAILPEIPFRRSQKCFSDTLAMVLG